MAKYVRKVEVVDAWEITPALIAARPEVFKEGVINPRTGLPVAPEDEEQAINAGWPRVRYLYTGGELASPLTLVRIGDYLVRYDAGEIGIVRAARFARLFEPAPAP